VHEEALVHWGTVAPKTNKQSLHNHRMNARFCDEMLQFVDLNYGTSPEPVCIFLLSFIAAVILDVAGCYAFCSVKSICIESISATENLTRQLTPNGRQLSYRFDCLTL